MFSHPPGLDPALAGGEHTAGKAAARGFSPAALPRTGVGGNLALPPIALRACFRVSAPA